MAAGNDPLRAASSDFTARARCARQNSGRQRQGGAHGCQRTERRRARRAAIARLAERSRARSRRGYSPGRSLDTPEKLFTQKLWDDIYGVPKGDVTIEHIQHAFYMAANYGFQILNGNFAAAIDDYELKLRFMNDLATYRIDVSWLWTLAHHQAAITKDGWLKRQPDRRWRRTGRECQPREGRHPLHPRVVRQGLEVPQRVDSRFLRRTGARGEPGRFDRAKAPVIMDLLKRQLLSPRYIQHSARVLFEVGQANARSASRFCKQSSICRATRSSSASRQARWTRSPLRPTTIFLIFSPLPKSSRASLLPLEINVPLKVGQVVLGEVVCESGCPTLISPGDLP